MIEQLNVSFEVRRSLSAKVANSAEITVFNLAESTRKKLQAATNVFVALEAGYAKGRSVIYSGQLREAWSNKEGNEWKTTVSSADAEQPRKKKRIQKSFPANTKVSTIITECAKALGVGLGNSATVSALAVPFGVKPAVVSTGYVASGDALAQLDRVLRSCGIEWSIQDGQLQLMPRSASLPDEGIELSKETGLIGSPDLGKKLVVRCRTLMIPGLLPGRRVHLKTNLIDAVYRIETTTHRGEFEGSEWGCELELKEPKS